MRNHLVVVASPGLSQTERRHLCAITPSTVQIVTQFLLVGLRKLLLLAFITSISCVCQDFILQVCCLATLDSSVGSPKTSLSSKVMNEDDGSETPVPSGMLLKPSPARTSTENEPTLVVTPSPRTDRALSVDLLAPTPPTSVPEPMTSAPTDSQDHHPEEEPEEEVEEPEEVPNPKHL